MTVDKGSRGPLAVTNPWSVTVVHWPEHAEEADALAAAGRLRLLLVAPGVDPPIDSDLTSDWLRRPADSLDVLLRIENLQRRSDATEHALLRLDDDGLLWVGNQWVALAPLEVRMMEALLQSFHRVVSRGDLTAAVWPEGAPGLRTLDARLQRVRGRITSLGLEIVNVRQRGFMLTDAQSSLDVNAARFGAQDPTARAVTVRT